MYFIGIQFVRWNFVTEIVTCSVTNGIQVTKNSHGDFLVNLFDADKFLVKPLHIAAYLAVGDAGVNLGRFDNTFAGTTIIIIFAPT